jgi:hypothetical protein
MKTYYVHGVVPVSGPAYRPATLPPITVVPVLPFDHLDWFWGLLTAGFVIVAMVLPALF